MLLAICRLPKMGIIGSRIENSNLAHSDIT